MADDSNERMATGGWMHVKEVEAAKKLADAKAIVDNRIDQILQNQANQLDEIVKLHRNVEKLLDVDGKRTAAIDAIAAYVNTEKKGST